MRDVVQLHVPLTVLVSCAPALPCRKSLARKSSLRRVASA